MSSTYAFHFSFFFDQLGGQRWRRRRVDAAGAFDLSFGGDRGRGDVGVGRAVGRGFRRRALAAEQGDLVGQPALGDGVVVGEQLALRGQGLRQIRRRRGLAEGFFVAVFAEHDQEHVFDFGAGFFFGRFRRQLFGGGVRVPRRFGGPAAEFCGSARGDPLPALSASGTASSVELFFGRFLCGRRRLGFEQDRASNRRSGRTGWSTDPSMTPSPSIPITATAATCGEGMYAETPAHRLLVAGLAGTSASDSVLVRHSAPRLRRASTAAAATAAGSGPRRAPHCRQ